MSRRKRNRRLKDELRAHRFYPTVAACNVWFSIINDEVFGNRLVPVTLVVRRLRGIWGYYREEPSELVVTDSFPSKNLFLNILAHEMVHAFQHQTGTIVNHGKSFWEWRKRFSRNGLLLAVRYPGS